MCVCVSFACVRVCCVVYESCVSFVCACVRACVCESCLCSLRVCATCLRRATLHARWCVRAGAEDGPVSELGEILEFLRQERLKRIASEKAQAEVR